MSTSTITLAQLRTESRYKADQVNSQFVTDAELTTYINASAYELYDLIVTAYGEDYEGGSTYTFTTDGTSREYDLPSDFYKLMGVDLYLSTNQDSAVSLKPFKFNERNRFAVPNMQTTYGCTDLRYRLLRDKMIFNIIPSASQTIKLWYVPQMTKLVNDADTLDGISGWYEYVTTDAAIKMMQKEESDTSVLVGQKMALIKRINDTSSNRDQGESQQVSDTNGFGGYGGNNGFDGSFGGGGYY